MIFKRNEEHVPAFLNYIFISARHVAGYDFFNAAETSGLAESDYFEKE
jgi:hypothetical protein